MDRAQILEGWLRSGPGGYIHPHLHLAEDGDRGMQWKAGDALAAGTKILTVPHAYALSYLNALVDDDYLVFKARRKDFTVEAIGFFYLMLQYINRSSSFWKPYLDTLPSPTHQLTTPLWFDDDEDKAWLADTDVAHTMSQRKVVYEEYYTSGVAILKDSGIDTSHFSWDYFRWAITIFTSRSFPSRAIAPHDSKYWTTYKVGQNGQRQTVLLDMRYTPAEDLDFSVLFPVIDAGNHDYRTRVHWDFDPGRFSITTLDKLHDGAEVCNNYGPKANDELLQGYGFCIRDNPYDVVLLTLRPPPQGLQDKLRSTHSGYFDARGAWLSDKATFKLPRLAASAHVFDALPGALVELLVLTVRHESGFQVDPTDSLMLQQRYSPHVARVVIASLTQKWRRLESISPQSDPIGLKQVYAGIYRQSQIDIARSYVLALQAYLQSQTSRSTALPSAIRLVCLEDIATDTNLVSAPILDDFLTGIEANANTKDIAQLRAAGWEDDVCVLLLCFAWLSGQTENEGEQESAITRLAQEYGNAATSDNHEEGNDLLAAVGVAAAQLPSSLWAHPAWTVQLISSIGGAVLQNESFTLPRQVTDEEPEMAVFLCIARS